MSSGYARVNGVVLSPARQMIMQRSYQRSIRCVGALLSILSLAGCGGLPTGGGRTASTAMEGNEGEIDSRLLTELYEHASDEEKAKFDARER